MGLIPEHIIGEIRDRTDIVAVVGQHVKLRKAGINHKGLCPFHQEKSPSFNVNSEKGFFYCFGCQKKGDVFTFMMELEGRSFIEAAESLADRLGILIPTDSSPGAGQRSRRSDMLKAAGIAREFFRRALESDAGSAARAYLESRQIGPDITAAFGLGYAPGEWSALGDHLRKSGVADSIAEAAGLVIPRKSGNGTYDRFRDRLMCPVANSSGDCVGFSGRRLAEATKADEAGAKYINSPENAIYKKSHLLYGLDVARAGFRERGRAILVEGNFDVVSLHQAGFSETVAPLGTALTSEQAVRLHRLVPRVVLLFDGDDAGRKATLKSLQTLLGAELDVRIARMPIGADPDDLVRQSGAEALEKIVEVAQPGVEYFIDNAWTEAGSSAHGRANAIAEAAQVLRCVPDAAKRDLLIGQFAQALGTDPATLRTHLRGALIKQRDSNRDGQSRQPLENKQVVRALQPAVVAEAPRLELDILAILADHPQLIKAAETLNVFSLLTDSRLRDMYSAARQGRPMLSETENLSPDMAERVLGGMYAAVDSPAQCLEAVVSRLVQMRRRQGLDELQKQAELARRRGDAETARTLVSEILMIRKQVD